MDWWTKKHFSVQGGRTYKKGYSRELLAILDVAYRVKEESVFQKEPLYIEFKAKYHGQRAEIAGLYHCLLTQFDFYQESAYWCHKFLSGRVCNKEERFDTFQALIRYGVL